jgi:hypothetical protein
MTGSWTSLDALWPIGIHSSERPAIHMFQQGVIVSHRTREEVLGYHDRAGRVACGAEALRILILNAPQNREREGRDKDE